MTVNQVQYIIPPRSNPSAVFFSYTGILHSCIVYLCACTCMYNHLLQCTARTAFAQSCRPHVVLAVHCDYSKQKTCMNCMAISTAPLVPLLRDFCAITITYCVCIPNHLLAYIIKLSLSNFQCIYTHMTNCFMLAYM